MKKTTFRYFSLLMPLLMVGCGGDGGALSATDTTPPPASVLSATLQPNNSLSFSWLAVPQATRYELVEDFDGDAGTTGDRVIATLSAGTLAYQVTDVFLAGLSTATYRVRTCTVSACTDSASLAIDPATRNSRIVYVKSTVNVGAGEFFGTGVALSGSGHIMAVSALADNQLVSGINPTLTGATAQRVGAVYLYDRGVGGWAQTAYVKASDASALAEFGTSLSLSQDGNVMVVGAYREDSGLADSGAVYFFRRQAGGVWVEENKFKAPTPQANGWFGAGVRISANGEWAAVSHLNVASGGELALYRHVPGTGWVFVQTVTGSNTEPGDWFGGSFGLSDDGSVLAVGAYQESSSTAGGPADNSVPGSGAVYVFRLGSGGWAQSAFLKDAQASVQARYGSAVTLSGDGNRLVVGGPQVGATAGTPPYVEVLDAATTGWNRSARLSPQASSLITEYGRGGMQISRDGNLLAVGAPEEDGDGIGLSGYVATNGTQDSGAVYLFRRNASGVWSAPGYVKASNSRSLLKFGVSIALASEANMMAVGGPSDSSNATGIGGDQTNTSATNAGAVYVY